MRQHRLCNLIMGLVAAMVFTACSSGTSNDQRHTLATDAATIDEVVAILERRLADVRGAKVEKQDLDGVPHIMVETNSRLADQQELEDLLLRPGRLEFRKVDADNKALSEKALIPGRTPNGFKVVTRERHRIEQSYLMAWNLKDWRAHPKIAEQFQLDLQDEAAFEAALASPAFAEKIEQTLREYRPADKSDLMLQRSTHPKSGEILYQPYYVELQPRMKGDIVAKTKVTFEYGEIFLLLEFTQNGRKEFGKLSTRLSPNGDLAPPPDVLRSGQTIPVGAALAAVLDGVLLTAPRINEPILGGTAQITGDFTMDEANTLARLLNAGEYPAPVTLKSYEKLP